MLGLVRRLVDDDAGAETVEYALVLALRALAAVAEWEARQTGFR